MNRKRLSALVLALAMTTSTAAFAAGESSDSAEGDMPLLISANPNAEKPEGWTPADGARGDLLISPNPNAGKYDTTITINGEALESYEYPHDIPGWGSETLTRQLSELPAVPAGYVPMRAVTQADHGYASWYKEESMSTFSLGGYYIKVSFLDMSVTVDDALVEGVQAILLDGTTYLPVSVIDSLDGFEVVDNSADGAESYEIKTPNGAPLIKLAYQLLDTADTGRGQNSTPEDLELVWGDNYGFKASYVTGEFFASLPMMISPDTLILGQVAEGQTEALQASLEAFRAYQEETFSWYLSHNLPKVQDARFVTEGSWFMFLIGDNADEVVEQFRAGVQKLESEANYKVPVVKEN